MNFLSFVNSSWKLANFQKPTVKIWHFPVPTDQCHDDARTYLSLVLLFRLSNCSDSNCHQSRQNKTDEWAHRRSSYWQHELNCNIQWVTSLFGLVFRWDHRWVQNTDWDQRSAKNEVNFSVWTQRSLSPKLIRTNRTQSYWIYMQEIA